jgi:GTP-binding protein YchF
MTLLRFGLVGLPNVGKSTIFNKIAKQELAQASNFPFCTIDPNVAVVPVWDPKVEKLSAISKSKKTVFSRLQCIDIAGLVKGASDNVGLGNQFLENIRQVELIWHVVRIFEDDNIQHVNNRIDPIDDIDTINTELILSDMDMCNKIMNHKKSSLLYKKNELDAIKKALSILEDGAMINSRLANFSVDDLKFINQKGLLTAKPMIYIGNMGGNSNIDELQRKLNVDIIPLRPMEDDDITNLIMESYKKLGLISFYTTGDDESRAWAIRSGTNARKAAGEIHSDFEQKFIRAAVMKYDDFVSGKRSTKTEGADYIVQDGDICDFRVGK